MKVSEITMAEICQQIRESPEELSLSEIAQIGIYRDIAVGFVESDTGIRFVDGKEEDYITGAPKLDDYPDITGAVLMLIEHLYDNRGYTVDKAVINPAITTILGHHQFNLLPEAENGSRNDEVKGNNTAPDNTSE